MKYLFVGSHVDDNELMCGGTISRLIEEGHQVKVISLSHTYNGINLFSEWSMAMRKLNVSDHSIFDFKTRHFSRNSDEILQMLYKIGNFDYVFTHSTGEFHSDHETTAKQVIRVFKHTNLLTYQAEWNNRQFTKNFFVKLEKRHVEKKLEALECYKSQQSHPYFNEDFIIGSMKVNGLMCGADYAEAYEVINYTI